MNEAQALEFAKTLAHEAGAIMLKEFMIGVTAEYKDDKSPVTIADTAINDLVIEKIIQAYPTHSVRGEEASNMLDGSEYVWVCDPIDGTTAFSHGIPTNVFSLTLTKDGQPILGVVYDPYMERLYTAHKGNGVFVNGRALKVNQQNLDTAWLGLASFHSPYVDAPKVHYALERRDIRRLCSTSTIYESMLVAAGQLGGQIYVNTKAHDVASAKLFVEEAGGRVTDLFGQDQRYDQEVTGMVASNGIIHDELLAILAENRIRPKYSVS